MPERLQVPKTYKLFIGGQFPRSESGRSMETLDRLTGLVAHVCRASRKDLRDAVVAARTAAEPWRLRDAYNRSQILYRLAEVMEGKRRELEEAIGTQAKAHSTKHSAQTGNPKPESRIPNRRPQSAVRKTQTPASEVSSSIDRVIAYAGWADKFSQVLGCNNAVVGPYYNFTVAEGTGVCAVVAPDEPSLLGLVSLVAPPLCAGCSIVALASETNPIPACILAEAFATSDTPPGVVNILTGRRDELIPWIAEHRDIDCIHAAVASDEHSRMLRAGAGENLKRVHITPADTDWSNADDCESPRWIEPFVEFKTIWHPSGS